MGKRERDLRLRSVPAETSSIEERGLSPGMGREADDSCLVDEGKGSGLRIFLRDAEE